MLKKRYDHVCPHTVILRRSCISLPIENCLSASCKLIRHEAQLKIRTDIQLDESVEYSVKISIVILYLDLAFLFIFMIDCHIICKKSVPSDVLESYFILYKLKLLKVFFRKSKSETACSDAEIHIVVKCNRV